MQQVQGRQGLIRWDNMEFISTPAYYLSSFLGYASNGSTNKLHIVERDCDAPYFAFSYRRLTCSEQRAAF
jgi:hypothetical protein